MKKIYAMVTGLALGLGILMDSAAVEEKFTLLENVPAQTMSQSEMVAVEGKQFRQSLGLSPSILSSIVQGLCGSSGTCAPVGTFSLTHVLGLTQYDPAQELHRLRRDQAQFNLGLGPFLPLLGRGVPGFPSTLASPFGSPVSIPSPEVARRDLCRQLPFLCGF